MDKPALVSLSMSELQEKLQALGLPSYRAKQIWDWVFVKKVFEFEKMTNLSKADREMLAREFNQILPTELSRQTDKHGTIKLLLPLSDGNAVECVSIRDTDSITCCLSSQIGCPIGCLFCRTGISGFKRNLKAHEILTQFLALSRISRKNITNVVFMGMGEPFLNTKEVFSSIKLLTDKKGIGLGSRRITVSTIGVPEGIIEFSELPGEVNLAISLHSTDQSIRNYLIPNARNFSLEKIREAVIKYIAQTNRRVTFEVLLLDGINDEIHDALNLVQFCSDLLCHINILTLNQFPGCIFKPSSEEKIKKFKKELKKAGIPTTIRHSKGGDILAGCGQLAITVQQNLQEQKIESK